MQCRNNLVQIGLALHGYHDTHKEFPAATMANVELPADKRLSWMTAILPHIEHERVFKQIDASQPWDGEANRAAISVDVFMYRCPAYAQPSPGQTHYVGLAGLGPNALAVSADDPAAGFFGDPRRITLAHVKDGTSNTAAAIETTKDIGSWGAGGWPTARSVDPDEAAYIGDGAAFGAKHKSDTFFRTNPVCANVLYGDCSVRTLHPAVAPEVFRAITTIAGGEEVPPSD